MFHYIYEKNLFSIAKQLANYIQQDKISRERKPSFVSFIDSGFGSPAPCGSQKSLENSEETIENEVYQEMLVTRQIPFRDYVCHRCGIKGHMIQYCPTKNPKFEKTPYQGDKMSVGKFRCHSCNHGWRSEKAKANQPQTCRGCGSCVFAFKMYPKRF